MLRVSHLSGFGAGAGANSGYRTQAVDFDGSNDYLTRGADLDSNGDTQLGLLSFWFRMDGGDAATQHFFYSSGGFVFVCRLSTNKIFINMTNPAGTSNVVRFTSSTSYTAGAAWHHACATWNLGSGLKELYIDGVDEMNDGSGTVGDCDYTRSNHAIGATDAGGSKLDGAIAELYFNFAEALDISDPANLAKFRSVSGKPVDLGADGSLPTGSQPIIYHRVAPGAAASTFATNLGYGGNFSITGSLDIASSSPSD